MGEVKEYPEGTFCWIDLGTTDVAGAKAFYGALFGWEFADMGGAGYTLCRLDAQDVAGIHEHAEQEGVQWSSYVAVEDVEAATVRARELGATVKVDPIDVPGTARMSVIRDPSGAEVSLWQSEGFQGARLVNEVGAWSWNELTTPEVEAATAFYGELFGWMAKEVPAPIPRASLTMGDLLVGGLHVPAPEEDPTPRWTVSFRVADADRTVERAQELRGRVVLPPIDIPIGRFAIVADPAGAAFTVAAFPGGAFRGVDGS
jgi:predicted enzyme related to lactoylglutathione lyase